MPTYITLFRYTEQGIKNIKESPNRIDAGRQAIQAAGGQLKAWYLTMGEYDGVIIAEGPDDETAAKFLLATAAQGNIRTQTLRAFTEDEFRQLVGTLP